MRIVALITALAACAACADLPDVDPDGCGNLVVNASEDCDGFGLAEGDGTVCGEAGEDNECFFVCDTTSLGICPDGWGCGGDGRCRRASGFFEEAVGSPWRFAVQDFDIGDVDGDGNEDLVGNDVSALTLRFGSTDGQFATDLDVVIPQAQGPVTVARFDSDELVDVVVPMAGGLFVALGSEERDLLPVAYAPFSLGDIGDNGVGGVVLESDGGDLNTEVVVMIGNSMTFLNSIAGPTTMPAGFDVTDVAGRIPTADLDQDGQRMEMAMAFAGDDQVFLFTSTGPASSLQVSNYSAPINLPAPYRVQFGAQFADVDGVTGPDLLVSVKHVTNMKSSVAVALNNGSGGLGVLTVQDVFERGATDGFWPLATGDFNGDGKADYVFADAVAIADIGGLPAGIPASLFPTAFALAEPWGEAVVGDFNGDEVADVAAVIESSDGVDFLFGVTVNGAPAGFFNPFHIDTEEPPRSLRVGDFDGDFIHDVAFVEAGFFVQPDGVSVIFGDTAGGPVGPFEMGTLGFVDVLEPISMVVSADTLDATTDLFVLSSAFPDRDAKAVAILFGSSSRRMLSPFSLSPPVSLENPNPQPDNPRRAMIGEFSDIAEGIRDIVAVTEPRIDSTGGTPPDNSVIAHLWRVAGEGGDGGLDAEDAAFVDMPAVDEFHSGCSAWDSGDIDGDGMHEVVAIDNSVGRDFSCFGFGGSPPGRLLVGTVAEGAGDPFTSEIGELAGDLRAVRDLALRDLDGDGDVDLLAVFAGEVRAGGSDDVPEGAGIGVIWNDGSLDPTAMDAIDVGARVFDADAITLDDTGVPALLILADRQVMVAMLDPETHQFGEPVVLADQKGDGRIEVGDVNADGVSDFAFTVGAEVHVFLGVPAPPRGGGDGVVVPLGGD